MLAAYLNRHHQVQAIGVSGGSEHHRRRCRIGLDAQGITADALDAIDQVVNVCRHGWQIAITGDQLAAAVGLSLSCNLERLAINLKLHDAVVAVGDDSDALQGVEQ